MAERHEHELRGLVNQFLKEFKALVYEKGLVVTNRQINRDHLLELGLTARQREEIILNLSALDYSSGPKADEYEPGDYWVFGCQIDGVEVYIKLKIAGRSGVEHAVCLSFHKAEHPMKYPLA